jgi:parvulin-like peptidyl-prolyl isomerase
MFPQKERTLKKIIFALAALAVAFASGCGEKDYSDLAVAKVDTRTITVAEFEKVSETIDESYLPATDDLEGKKELLKHMINKEVMALKALAMGYDKEQWFVDFWPQYRGPFLIAQLMDRHVAQTVEITEADIEAYWQEMHWEYTLSQIVVAHEDEAIELRQRALDGEDFAELAKKYSLGAGAEHGGYVGANPVGRIHWWVEEELFGMEAGDISQPLKTSTGFAIIKLHRKRKVEPQFDRDWAAKRVKAIEEKKGMEDLKAKIEVEIGLQFYTDAVNIAYDALPEDVSYEDIMSYKITRENAPRLNLDEQFKDMILCQYDDGSYTLGDFEELYYKLGLPERPRRQYGREHIIMTVHKIIFDQVLPVYAEQTAKILEIPEVRDNLENKKELFLVQRLYDDQIKDEVTVTLTEKREYYAENLDILLKLEMRDFSVVLLPDFKTASDVHKMATEEGMNFSTLIRKFSTDEESKDDFGRTGLHVRGSMKEYDDVGFALDGPGAISEPFQVSRGWAILKVEEVENERVPTYEEAEPTIQKALTELKYEEHLNEKIEKWSEDYIIEVYEDALDKAVLKRTRL